MDGSDGNLDRSGDGADRLAVDRFGAGAVVVVELTWHGVPTDDEDNDLLANLTEQAGLRVVATTGAHYACPEDGLLGSAVAAVRARRSLDEMDGWLPAGHSRFLRREL